MPKEGNCWQENDRRETNQRSSAQRSHRSHHRHGGGHQDSSREHRRHRPYHRERTPRSSTHIYFNGVGTAPSLSLRTDHATLASSLTSLVDPDRNQQIEDLLAIVKRCCEVCEMRQRLRLRQEEAVHSTISPLTHNQTSASSSSGHGGAHQSNVVSIPKSTSRKTHSVKPSPGNLMEQRKITSLVPAADTKRRLRQSLSSHSEAKFESIDISLFCPLTHSRMATPVRGKNCQHIHCFDGEAFCNLMWEKPSSKWKCPICKCHAPLPALIVDGFITEVLAAVPEDIRSVEFTSDGNWQIKERTSSQSIRMSSLNMNPDARNNYNDVIDLTLDSPVKVVKKNSLKGTGNSTPQVIDLTLSP